MIALAAFLFSRSVTTSREGFDPSTAFFILQDSPFVKAVQMRRKRKKRDADRARRLVSRIRNAVDARVQQALVLDAIQEATKLTSRGTALMGELLCAIQGQGHWQSWGFSSFRDFVEQRCPFSYRTAQQLIRVYVRWVGKKNPDPASIGAYGHGDMNYDHQAILTTSRLFEENTKNENRIMLVLSDGHPNGWHYGGSAAIKATRDAVDSVRRKGIRLLAVAIEDYQSEPIYGARYVVHFTELSGLVADMRKLITNIIRSSVKKGSPY